MISREPLQVGTDHLNDLATRHTRAAAQITSATEQVSDLDRRIRATHGVIATSTAGAVEMLQHLRRRCGAAIAGDGQTMSEQLIASARRYDRTDQDAGEHLDKLVRPQ